MDEAEDRSVLGEIEGILSKSKRVAKTEGFLLYRTQSEVKNAG